jgi:mitogen-activated protein kinase 1/3
MSNSSGDAKISPEIQAAQRALDSYCAEEYKGRYSLIKFIGNGAYGAVFSAYDNRTNSPRKKVAIKLITNAFTSPLDSRRLFREIKCQAHFSNHINITPLLDIVKPINFDAFRHIYLVTELFESDLHHVIRSKQEFNVNHISYFLYQLLCGLQYIHKGQVLHRDLKPSNILVNSDCSLKICDFGLARESDMSYTNAHYTEYVVTRYYRAPEVLLSSGKYDEKVDIWSLGCILSELLLRKVLFPGDNYLHQLQLILSILGKPSLEDCYFIKSKAALNFLEKLPATPPVSFLELFPTFANSNIISLLERMLVFNPAKRASIEECLAHPFLSRVRLALKKVHEDPYEHPPPFSLRVPGGSRAFKNMGTLQVKQLFYQSFDGNGDVEMVSERASSGEMDVSTDGHARAEQEDETGFDDDDDEEEQDDDEEYVRDL